MEALIELIIVFAIGWILGHRTSTAIHLTAFRTILRELGVTREQLRKMAWKNGIHIPDDEPEDTTEDMEVIHIKLESHQGQIYAFRKDNDAFLGQGADRDSLIAALAQRMNNVRLIIDDGEKLLQKSHSQTG